MKEPNRTVGSVEELAREFNVEAPVSDLSRYAFEDWVTLAVFWLMGICVFLQFFTRYVLNESLSWTEEVAINCLMLVVFLGSVMCVRMSRHIRVDAIYRYLPARAARVLSLLVGVGAIAFFAYASYLVWRFTALVADQRMISIDVPRGVIFYMIFAAFILMMLRSVQVLVQEFRHGRPELSFPDLGEGR